MIMRASQQPAATQVAAQHAKLLTLCLAPIAAVGLQGDYTRGHDERLPYTDGSMRSIYHIRDFEVYRLMQVCCWRCGGLGWSLLQYLIPGMIPDPCATRSSMHSHSTEATLVFV